MPGMQARTQLRKYGRWGIPLAALLLTGGVLLWRGGTSAPEEAGGAVASLGPGARDRGASPTPAQAPSRARPPEPTPGAAAAPGTGEVDRELWTRRLERSQQVLDRYRESTRYPPDSRPASEHPDQLHPGRPIERERPLNPEDRSGEGAQLRVSQDRVFLAGAEAVRLTVGCMTSSGAPLPCQVVSAAASAIAETPEAAALPSSPVAFSGDGRPGNDLTATFQPPAGL